MFQDIDDTIEHDSFTLRARIEYDSDTGAPWEEHDGHGPVSDWTRRDKLPGELILCDDGRQKRFYDFAEACRIARRDGWNAAPYGVPGETPRQRAAKAAMADFEYLRGWRNDQWNWCGVVVTASRAGVELGAASLWGIESDAGAYLVEVANELTAEALAEAADKARGDDVTRPRAPAIMGPRNGERKMIHREYARLCAADRAVVDNAFKAATEVFRAANRRVSNTDAAERAVEALAAYLIESGGHARIGDGRNHTAIAGDIHPSYTGD